MNRLEGIKVGDIIYHVTKGEVIVEEITDNEIEVSLKRHCFTYTSEGYMFKGDIHPSLFRSRKDMIEYFSNLPKIDIAEELSKLDVAEFERNKTNCLISWSYDYNKIVVSYHSSCEYPNMMYFKDNDKLDRFINRCHNNDKMTKEQFFEAYNKVFGGKNV